MSNRIPPPTHLSAMVRVPLFALLATAAFQVAHAQVATMPPEAAGYAGATRGYWFTAPVSFQITGIHVLAPTGSGDSFMNWAVLRFNNATPPPTFPAATGAFTQLGLGFDQPANAFSPVSILISAGDVIGIYGSTTATFAGPGETSYASPVGRTTIFGNSVVLARSGMQFNLGSSTSPTGMHDVWQEDYGNIGRVEFSYTTVPEPSTVAFALLAVASLVGRRLVRIRVGSDFAPASALAPSGCNSLASCHGGFLCSPG